MKKYMTELGLLPRYLQIILGRYLILYCGHKNRFVGSREDIGIMFQFRWISQVHPHSKQLLHFMNPILISPLEADHGLLGLAHQTWEATRFRQLITFHYGMPAVQTTLRLIAYLLQQSRCRIISLTRVLGIRSGCKKVYFDYSTCTINFHLANYLVIYRFPTTSTTVTDLSGNGYTGSISIFISFLTRSR